MFISFDNGGHWQSFQLNLPNVPVSDIKIHRDDLIVSTQGRAFWIIDNISSLEQLTPQVSTSQVYLFKPRDGYRTRVSPTNLGPTIEYYLSPGPNDPVTMAVQATVTVGDNPLAGAWIGDELWVPNIGSGTVSVVSSSTNAVARTITVGPSPIALAYAAGSAWVTSEDDGDLWRLDTAP